MTDLDQSLADAFARRAATVTGSALSPQTVHRAVRRQRVRTVQGGVAGLAAVAVTVTGLVLSIDRRHGATGPTTPATPSPLATATTAPDVVASLPWAGGTRLVLRSNVGGSGYVACFGASCGDIAPAGTHAITMGDDNAGIFGLAPVGTESVAVSMDGGPATEVMTAASGPGHDAGVLFADPSAVTQDPAGSAFTHSYTVTARDSKGRTLAHLSAVGGIDLARAHPPASTVLQLSSDGPADPSFVGWGDQRGWACWGERAAGSKASYAAIACVPPTDPGRLTMVGEDNLHGAVVVRVPARVAKLELRSSHGDVIAESRVTAVGQARLAYLNIWPAAGATVVGLDAKGRTVASTSTEDLTSPTGTVTAGATT